jgi:hypothetical protein
MELFIQDKNGRVLPVQSNPKLETSPILKEWIRAPKESDDDTLHIPYTLFELEVALNRNTYDFESWNRVVSCASYLDITLSEDVIRVAQLFTMECIRASGINPAHFHEASLFSQMLSCKDDRFQPVDVQTLESLYWMCLMENVNLESLFQNQLGADVYEAAVCCTRSVREELQNSLMMRMTSIKT